MEVRWARARNAGSYVHQMASLASLQPGGAHPFRWAQHTLLAVAIFFEAQTERAPRRQPDERGNAAAAETSTDPSPTVVQTPEQGPHYRMSLSQSTVGPARVRSGPFSNLTTANGVSTSAW